MRAFPPDPGSGVPVSARPGKMPGLSIRAMRCQKGGLHVSRSIKIDKSIAGYLILLILLILNDTVGHIGYSVFVLAWAAFLMIAFDPVLMIVPCILTSTIQSYFLIAPTLSFSRILSLFFIAGYILHRRLIIRKSKETLFLILFAAYHLLTVFWSVTGSYSEPVSFAIGIAMIILLGSTRADDATMARVQTLIYGMCYIFGLFVVFLTIRLSRQVGESQVVFDESLNANTICSTLALFISIIYGKLLFKIGNKLLDYLFILVCTITILFAGSRTSLIGVLGTIVILPFLNNTNRSFSFKVRRLLGLTLLLAVIVGTLYYYMSNNTDLYERFTFASTSTKSIDRRVFVWEALWKEIIPKNLLIGIGYGIGNVREAVAPYVEMAYHSHNMFLGILSETGLIGLAMYLLLYADVIKKALRSINPRMMIAFGMLVTGLLIGIGEEVINRRWFWLAIGLVFLFDRNRAAERK